MANTILDVTTFPQSFTTGNFPITTLNDGVYGFNPTFTLASSNAAWSTNAVDYWCLLSCNDQGGVWLYNDGSNTIRIAIFDVAGGGTIVEVVVASTGNAWAASASPRVVVDNVANTITLTGWPQNNGSHAFTGSTTGDAFATSPLGVGVYGGGGYAWSGSMSDIDDANDSVNGAAAVTLGTLTAASAGTLAVAGSLASTLGTATSSGTGAVALSGSATPTLGTLTSAGAGTVGVAGAAAVTLGVLTTTADGTVGGSDISGEAVITLGTLASSGAGTVAIDGTSAARSFFEGW